MSFLFNRHKSLSELQEEEEYNKELISVQKQKALLKELKARGGDPSWFNSWRGIINWLKK